MSRISQWTLYDQWSGWEVFSYGFDFCFIKEFSIFASYKVKKHIYNTSVYKKANS